MGNIVKEFEQVNAFFQATNADPEKMVKELDLHYRSLRQRLFYVQGQTLAMSLVEFGAHFQSEALRCVHESKNGPSFGERVERLKERCHEFLLEVLQQVQTRLPQNKAIFQGLHGLHPTKVLSQAERLNFSLLPLRHLLENNVDIIEAQYQKILLHIWKEEEVFKDEFPIDDTVKFWSGISRHKNALGEHPYKELASYVLSCLTMPVSNAVVERIFSHVTNVKTKLRNSLSIEMLDAIIRIRTTLVSQGICCKVRHPIKNKIAKKKMVGIFLNKYFLIKMQ